MDQEQGKIGCAWMGLIILAIASLCGFMLWDGVRWNCGQAPLRDGAGLVIGSDCPPVEAEPERVIVYRVETRIVEKPVIDLETVKFIGWMTFPVSLIIAGGAGVVLALKAKLGV